MLSNGSMPNKCDAPLFSVILVQAAHIVYGASHARASARVKAAVDPFSMAASARGHIFPLFSTANTVRLSLAVRLHHSAQRAQERTIEIVSSARAMPLLSKMVAPFDANGSNLFSTGSRFSTLSSTNTRSFKRILPFPYSGIQYRPAQRECKDPKGECAAFFRAYWHCGRKGAITMKHSRKGRHAPGTGAQRHMDALPRAACAPPCITPTRAGCRASGRGGGAAHRGPPREKQRGISPGLTPQRRPAAAQYTKTEGRATFRRVLT